MKRNNNGNSIEETITAPQPNRWYTLTLGASFKDQQHRPSPKFCTLRYGFKPASIDKSQPGTLHKDKENRVTVEFQNNQVGKPRVTYEGVISEDYKENDAVLFFDGETFRVERLHRAVKRLRLLESGGGGGGQGGGGSDGSSPPLGKVAKGLNLNKSGFSPLQVEVERIDMGDFGASGTKTTEVIPDNRHTHLNLNPSSASPDPKDGNSDEHLDIFNDDDNGYGMTTKNNEPAKAFSGIDVNLAHQMDPDDEFVDVDGNDDDDDIARNLEEALGAEMNEEGSKGKPTSSSSSSGSGSSGSSDSGSSSDSESSDGDSITSI
ncbi:hypothetical protein AKJ16_DCAP25241 [Drosera capensis]